MMRKLLIAIYVSLVMGIFPLASLADSGVVHEVHIQKYTFIPDEITIKVGDTVRWVNIEKRQYHSVWFKALGEEEPQYFFPDEHYERTFDKVGDYPYRCGPHKEMHGVVHVVE